METDGHSIIVLFFTHWVNKKLYGFSLQMKHQEKSFHKTMAMAICSRDENIAHEKLYGFAVLLAVTEEAYIAGREI